MFDSAILDVLVGLVSIYLLLSLACSALVEFINDVRNRRGAALEAKVRELLGPAAFAQFCALPGFLALKSSEKSQFAWLRADGSDFPAYIPNETFAELALAWKLRHGHNRELPAAQRDPFEAALARLYTDCGGDTAAFKQSVAFWFGQAMERMSGRFRQATNRWMAAVAVVLVVAVNADTLRMAERLYADPALRKAAVEQAEQLSKAQTLDELMKASAEPGATPAPPERLANLRDVLAEVPVLGWSEKAAGPQNWEAWLQRLTGYLITVLALMMGSDFWFNALRKLVRIRTSLKPDSNPSGDEGKAKTPPPSPAPQTIARLGADIAPELLGAAISGADWAGLAYDLNGSGLDRPVAPDSPWQLAAYFSAAQGSQAVLLRHGENGQQVLAFRGTEIGEMADIKTDLDCAPVPWSRFPALPAAAPELQIHEGFGAGLAVLWPELIARLDPAQPVTISGHSLGGALAMLAAYALHQHRAPGSANPVFRIAAVYTYGQPRVGNRAFAEAYDLALLGKTWRLVNNRDMVTRVPPQIMAFQHAGQCLYLDGEGRLHRDPSAWFQFLDRLPLDRDNLRAQLLEYGLDHPIKRYRERLAALQLPS